MSYRYDRENQIQQYEGTPIKQDDKERSRWQKFLQFFLPWITRKWELGNAYLEAKVAKEQNEADKIMAETLLLQIQAEKEIQDIIDITGYVDAANAESIELEKPAPQEELEADLQALEEKIKLMNLKYGFKISILIGENKEQNLMADESNQGSKSA